jgi:hypothetical protein
VTVIALSFYNVSTGLNLTGFNLNKISVAEEKAEIKQDSDSAGNLSNVSTNKKRIQSRQRQNLSGQIQSAGRATG